MNTSTRSCVLAAIFILLGCAAADAETFSVPLQWTVKAGQQGEYFSSNFDLHAQFSEVQSVSIQFSLPGGYESIGFAGGYFSATSDLWITLHRNGSEPNFGYFLEPTTTEGNLATNLSKVSAGSVQDIDLFPPVFFLADEPIAYQWPDFILAGKGDVALADYLLSMSGFAPDGPVSTTETWKLPGEVTIGSLTIVGTVVPEPTATVLLIQVAALAILHGAWLRITSSRARAWVNPHRSA